MTFREWPIYCWHCDQGAKIWGWDNEPIRCPDCGNDAVLNFEERGKAPGIIGDDIPGGLELRHLDATPRKYYSKTEIKRVCNEKGLTWSGDTPKPYNIPWSGKRIEPEVVKPLVRSKPTE